MRGAIYISLLKTRLTWRTPTLCYQKMVHSQFILTMMKFLTRALLHCTKPFSYVGPEMKNSQFSSARRWNNFPVSQVCKTQRYFLQQSLSFCFVQSRTKHCGENFYFVSLEFFKNVILNPNYRIERFSRLSEEMWYAIFVSFYRRPKYCFSHTCEWVKRVWFD